MALKLVRCLGSSSLYISVPFSASCSVLELSTCRRCYHSQDLKPQLSFSRTESAILSAALTHVPTCGFTLTALSNGARDVGYPNVSTKLLTRSSFDLVRFHLQTQRLALVPVAASLDGLMGTEAKMRALTVQRLRANEYIRTRWQEVRALARDCARKFLHFAILNTCNHRTKYLSIDHQGAGTNVTAGKCSCRFGRALLAL